jgi:hypothetical protein
MKQFKSKWENWLPTIPERQGAISDKFGPGTFGTELLRGISQKVISGITLLESNKEINRHDLSQASQKVRPGTALRMWSEKIQDFLIIAGSEADRKLLYSQFPATGIYLQNEMALVRGQGFSTKDLTLIHEIKKTFNANIREVTNISGLEVSNLTGKKDEYVGEK